MASPPKALPTEPKRIRKMRSPVVSLSTTKAHPSELIDVLSETRIPFIITKRGREVAVIMPAQQEKRQSLYGHERYRKNYRRHRQCRAGKLRGNVRVNGYLIDTHVWIWEVFAESKLSPSPAKTIDAERSVGRLFLSPISMWEVALKASRGKMDFHSPVRKWLASASTNVGLLTGSITPRIAADCAELPPEFHGDPADRIIAATARAEGLTFTTHDKKLLQLAKRGYFRALAT